MPQGQPLLPGEVPQDDVLGVARSGRQIGRHVALPRRGQPVSGVQEVDDRVSREYGLGLVSPCAHWQPSCLAGLSMTGTNTAQATSGWHCCNVEKRRPCLCAAMAPHVILLCRRSGLPLCNCACQGCGRKVSEDPNPVWDGLLAPRQGRRHSAYPGQALRPVLLPQELPAHQKGRRQNREPGYAPVLPCLAQPVVRRQPVLTDSTEASCACLPLLCPAVSPDTCLLCAEQPLGLVAAVTGWCSRACVGLSLAQP